MAKRKLHPAIHHGIRSGIPGGIGVFGGVMWAVTSAKGLLDELEGTEKTFQACFEIIESISLLG